MIVIGIDEVGRGCWAGPLVAGAVAFEVGDNTVDEADTLAAAPITGLNDSKKLSRARREVLDPLIREHALAYGLGWVEPSAIDSGGITTAVKRAMSEALLSVLRQLADEAYHRVEVIIDGSYNFLKDMSLPDEWSGTVRIRTMVRADGMVPSVSAASIIAKVGRDRFMIEKAHAAYPMHGFDRHVGYGTAAHIAALHAHGVTKIHRLSYTPVQNILTEHGGRLLQSAP